MKIAIAYKGFFLKQTIGNDVNRNYLNYAKKIIENHKNMILNHFIDDEVDFYFSTYNVEEFNNLYKSEFNPKSYTFISNQFFHGGCTWTSQKEHYKNLILNIKNQNICYDFYLITRQDLKFIQKFSDMNIDLKKFNITHEHPSGNCDDNFWFFPGEMFESFVKSIDDLILNSKITHEINHSLKKNKIDINYLTKYDYDSQPLGHKIFDICR